MILHWATEFLSWESKAIGWTTGTFSSVVETTGNDGSTSLSKLSTTRIGHSIVSKSAWMLGYELTTLLYILLDSVPSLRRSHHLRWWLSRIIFLISLPPHVLFAELQVLRLRHLFLVDREQHSRLFEGCHRLVLPQREPPNSEQARNHAAENNNQRGALLQPPHHLLLLRIDLRPPSLLLLILFLTFYKLRVFIPDIWAKYRRFRRFCFFNLRLLLLVMEHVVCPLLLRHEFFELIMVFALGALRPVVFAIGLCGRCRLNLLLVRYAHVHLCTATVTSLAFHFDDSLCEEERYYNDHWTSSFESDRRRHWRWSNFSIIH